jgi:chromosome segregation ATPase
MCGCNARNCAEDRDRGHRTQGVLRAKVDRLTKDNHALVSRITAAHEAYRGVCVAKNDRDKELEEARQELALAKDRLSKLEGELASERDRSPVLLYGKDITYWFNRACALQDEKDSAENHDCDSDTSLRLIRAIIEGRYGE